MNWLSPLSWCLIWILITAMVISSLTNLKKLRDRYKNHWNSCKEFSIFLILDFINNYIFYLLYFIPLPPCCWAVLERGKERINFAGPNYPCLNIICVDIVVVSGAKTGAFLITTNISDTWENFIRDYKHVTIVQLGSNPFLRIGTVYNLNIFAWIL